MTDEAMSPLRRRMIEDMTIRKFAPKTQHAYVQGIKKFAAFLGRSPDTASAPTPSSRTCCCIRAKDPVNIVRLTSMRSSMRASISHTTAPAPNYCSRQRSGLACTTVMTAAAPKERRE